jgi:hypothetical protein
MAFLQRYLDPSLGAVTAWHFCARKLAPKLAGARFNWHCCDTMMAPCKKVGGADEVAFCDILLTPIDIMTP